MNALHTKENIAFAPISESPYSYLIILQYSVAITIYDKHTIPFTKSIEQYPFLLSMSSACIYHITCMVTLYIKSLTTGDLSVITSTLLSRGEKTTTTK